jgi:hypothetical protein
MATKKQKTSTKKQASKATRKANGRAQSATGAPTAAKATKKASQAKEAKAAKPAAQARKATVLTLISRLNGATLGEIMKATGWQAHSVRGLISTLGSKEGLKIASSKNEAGERVYQQQA